MSTEFLVEGNATEVAYKKASTTTMLLAAAVVNIITLDVGNSLLWMLETVYVPNSLLR